MNTLPQAIVHRNQRVLTTRQLAEKLGTDEKHINDNFQNNKDQYVVGEDYFLVEGEMLKEFVGLYPETFGEQNASKIRKLYLWTEWGMLLHVKSLNTDQAWKIYKWLRNDYYQVKGQIAGFHQLQQQLAQLQQQVEQLGRTRPKHLRLASPPKERAIPERGYHVSSSRIEITADEERKLLIEYVERTYELYGGITANTLAHSFVKRFSTEHALTRLEEAARNGELEQFYTTHTRRSGGKFKPVRDDNDIA